jgi:hypothetical protein
MPKLIDKLPASLANRLRGTVVRQFIRFALVASVSLLASELTLSLAYLAGATGGVAGLCGWLVGAATSYLLSRWAWQRKGRPHLLKETLPFWAISVGTAAVLTLTSHFASSYAKHHGMPRHEAVIVVAVAYLVANFVTFMTRFLIFHYVLFADRHVPSAGGAGSAGVAGIEAESLSPIAAMVPSTEEKDERRLSRSFPATLSPPRAGDDPGEVQAVERVVPLLAVADLALVDGGGPFGDPVAVGQDADQELGRLVLRLLEPDRAGHLRSHRSQPEGRVGYPLAGQRANGQCEHPDAELADRVLGLLAALGPRP